MSVTIIPDVMQDMAEQNYRQQVCIVAETQMHLAPWLFEEEGWEKSRLKAAIDLVCTGKVTESIKGWSVAGSKTPYFIYRDTMACPCKSAEHGKTGVCKHRVAVELARRVKQAYPEAVPLPLPPVTVDERLAQAASVASDHVYDALPVPMEDRLALGMLHDSTALQTHHTPQEDRMPDDDAHYIAEPEDAPTAILEASDADFPPMGQPATPRPLPGPLLLPALDARTLEQSMQAWAAQRAVVKRFIQTQLVEGTDYYSLKIGQRETKPTLSKAGSEKFLGLFQLRASFTQDVATWTMLGKPEGTLCYVCTLHTRSGEIVSEGRGARRVAQDGDVNKAVKMAQKSATIDAVLRTGALSDAFTQDIGEPDEQPAPVQDVTPARPTSQDLRQRIWGKVQELAPQAKTREAVEAFITERTGMDLHPDLYQAIAARLGA